MKKLLNKGFTLIELLVVIAIIGILSSVVLASLSTARGKATDSKVQGQLSSMRSAAEIVYSNNGNQYASANNGCNAGLFTDTTSGMNALNANINAVANTYNCNATAQSWMAAAKLPSALKTWCVDSTGYSGYTGSSGANNASNSNVNCSSI